MPPQEPRPCSGLGEGNPGKFSPCANLSAGSRSIIVDGWGVRVDLCAAHATLWNTDIGPEPISRVAARAA
jgi:hypothetical protein